MLAVITAHATLYSPDLTRDGRPLAFRPLLYPNLTFACVILLKRYNCSTQWWHTVILLDRFAGLRLYGNFHSTKTRRIVPIFYYIICTLDIVVQKIKILTRFHWLVQINENIRNQQCLQVQNIFQTTKFSISNKFIDTTFIQYLVYICHNKHCLYNMYIYFFVNYFLMVWYEYICTQKKNYF